MGKKRKRVITMVTLGAAVLLIAMMAVFAFWYRGMKQDTAAGISDAAPPVFSSEPSSEEASALSTPAPERGSSSSTVDSSAPGISSDAAPVVWEHPEGVKSVIVKLLPEKGIRAEYRLSEEEVDAFLRLYNGIEMTFVSKAGEIPNPGDGSAEYLVEIEYPSGTDTLLLPTFRLNRDEYRATGRVHELLDYLESLSPDIHFDTYYYIPGREDGITGVELFGSSRKREIPESQIDGLLDALEESGFMPTGERVEGGTAPNLAIRVKGLYEFREYCFTDGWTMAVSRVPDAGQSNGYSGMQACTAMNDKALFDYLRNTFPDIMEDVSLPEANEEDR